MKEECAVQMTTELVDPTEDANWDRQVLSHPRANAFHSAAWARVLMTTYGHRPVYVRCTKGDRLVALVPLMEVQSLLRARRGISLPFSDFCDALLFDPSCEEECYLRLGAMAPQRNWRYLELRGTGCVPASATPAVSFYSHQLDLRGGPEAVSGRFRPSVRQALRKVGRTPLTVSIEHSEAAMRTFFPLHVLTRRRHGLPPQSLSFFLNIHREIIAQKMGFVVVVRLEGRPIAAMVFFHWGKTGIYKFGASDKSFQELRPNNLAMSTAIQSLAEAGSETLHFGRSSLSNAGLRRFKLTWGATEEMLHYYRYDIRRGEWGASRDRTEGLHTELFRRLPSMLNRLAGSLIYAHLD
ncbi:MAG: hypothetical protein QOE70_6109 [Chthoniobacter sp.]|nr:hypothetical protein [Chthoniobacter sp.]